DGKKVHIEGGAWQSGAINPDQGFINGLYAMIFSGPWNLKTFRDAGVSFGVSFIPTGPAGTSSTVGGTNLVVFRSCAYPEVAFEVLQYITSPEFQKQWCERLGQIPTRQGIELRYQDFPEMPLFYQQMQHTRTRPPIPRYDLVEQFFNPEIELVLKRIKSPQEALDSAVLKIDEHIISLLEK
ncbi:MAG: extracellular solute-binding protein, partial [Planctomycetota bacterium]